MRRAGGDRTRDFSSVALHRACCLDLPYQGSHCGIEPRAVRTSSALPLSYSPHGGEEGEPLQPLSRRCSAARVLLDDADGVEEQSESRAQPRRRAARADCAARALSSRSWRPTASQSSGSSSWVSSIQISPFRRSERPQRVSMIVYLLPSSFSFSSVSGSTSGVVGCQPAVFCQPATAWLSSWISQAAQIRALLPSGFEAMSWLSLRMSTRPSSKA